MEDAFCFADVSDLLKLVHPHRAAVGLKAIFAIDNVACGPAIGGVRWRPMSAMRRPSGWRER